MSQSAVEFREHDDASEESALSPKDWPAGNILISLSHWIFPPENTHRAENWEDGPSAENRAPAETEGRSDEKCFTLLATAGRVYAQCRLRWVECHV